MRYDNPELVEILSAEYVLGTLKGAARRRFEQLVAQKPSWLLSIQWWEKHLHVLADTLPAQQPHARVWANIQSQLFNKAASSQPAASAWSGLFKFLSTAIVASVATFLILQSPKEAVTEQYEAVAMLSSKTAESGWHLSLKQSQVGEARINAYSLASLVQKPSNAYELWLLPENSGKPISLGLLPQRGDKTLVVPAAVLAQFKNSNLAVSIEPVGGSPTGQPTGDVVYQGQLINIKKGLNS